MRAVVFCGICAWLLGGCSSPGGVTLVQPQLTGLQQEVRLASEQVYWAREGGTDCVLAEFPLPGATTGRPMYLLYLRLDDPLLAPSQLAAAHDETPDGEVGPETVEDTTPGEPPAVREQPERSVQGFLIQTRGQYAGRAMVVGGNATFRQPPRIGASRHLEFELALEEGSRISGNLLARWDKPRLTFFETQYAGDVAAVSAAARTTQGQSP